MFLLEIILTVYFISVIFSVLMAYAAIDNKVMRKLFALLGLVMPFVFLYGAIRSVFSPKRIPGCSTELAIAEDKIEARRIQIFGGEPTCPSFSNRWSAAYESYLDRMASKAVQTQTFRKMTSVGSKPHAGRV
jgi:hypothetical protein